MFLLFIFIGGVLRVFGGVFLLLVSVFDVSYCVFGIWTDGVRTCSWMHMSDLEKDQEPIVDPSILAGFSCITFSHSLHFIFSFDPFLLTFFFFRLAKLNI